MTWGGMARQRNLAAEENPLASDAILITAEERDWWFELILKDAEGHYCLLTRAGLSCRGCRGCRVHHVILGAL